MKDLDRLAVLDPAAGREPSAMEWTRAEAFVERTIAGVAARPAHAARRRWMMAGAAAVAAGIVGAVAVPALVPGAAERAVASWTAMPTARTGDQVLPQARACAGGEAAPGDVLLAEQRGEATLLILRTRDGLIECLSAGDDRFAMMGLADATFTPSLPAGAVVNLETMSSVGDDDEMFSNMVGLAAPEVTGIEVRLDDGRVFQASVKDGWWAAWWPGPEGGEVDELTVTVHAGGTTTSYRPSELP